jgi:hypothetical protein
MSTSPGRALRFSVAIAALGLAPLSAAAGTLVAASLSFKLGTLPAVAWVGSGVVGSSSGPLQVTIAAGSGFAGTVIGSIPTSAAPPISGLYFTAGGNATGMFSGAIPSLVGGAMAIDMHVCVEAYGLCLLDLEPPIGVAQTVIPPVVSGIGITMHGSNWTAGTETIALTGGGVATAMGSNGLNAKGAGTLVLVSSVNVLTSIAGQLPSFATLQLQFVPEPVAAALVGLAAVALALGLRRGPGS